MSKTDEENEKEKRKRKRKPATKGKWEN